MAWYVTVYLLLPNGQRDPHPEESGPFHDQSAAEQYAIALGHRSNVAKVEIKYQMKPGDLS